MQLDVFPPFLSSGDSLAAEAVVEGTSDIREITGNGANGGSDLIEPYFFYMLRFKINNMC